MRIVERYIHSRKRYKYTIVNICREMQVDDEWLQTITYADCDGNEYVRTVVEFDGKFIRIKE